MSMTVIKEMAFAKINLTLDVLGLRPDGYHDLRSVMQSVSLCDELEIALDSGSWSVHCDDPGVPSGEDNLVLRAARAYCTAADVQPNGIEITLRKRIPMQAGLGGGSSDAAAVLRALNRHYGRLSREALLQVAQTVGSDVPFCVCGGTMLCKGRGEILSAVPALQPCWFVICKPSFSISTPELFRRMDANPQLAAAGAQRAEQAIFNQQLPQGSLTNRFEPLLELEYPVITQLRETLLASGACLASLSGSGSAYYGLFADPETAATAKEALASLVPQTFLAQPV